MYDEGSIFLGSHKEFGDVMVAPSLLDYVAQEVEREVAVMKQVRKAREERSLARGGTWRRRVPAPPTPGSAGRAAGDGR